ncbi:MAG: sigma-54-dependent Fis family transcriptional regulator [Burkholderiaceae bacterium]
MNTQHARTLTAAAAADDGAIAPVIRRSWTRCLDEYRLEPDRVPDPPVMTVAEYDVARAPTDELAALSNGEIDRLFRQLAGHVHLLMLADARGTLMAMRCEPALRLACEAARILPGSIWDEASQGTNGVGLCIREERPVSVVMSDHFATRLAGLSCTVAPIFGEGGRLAAVLNVTSLRESNRTVHAIARQVVQASARRIENRAFDVRCAGRVVLRLSNVEDFCDPAGEARVALDDAGIIIDATPAALTMLGGSAARIGARMPGITDLDTLGRALRAPQPRIETLAGSVGIRLADASSRPELRIAARWAVGDVSGARTAPPAVTTAAGPTPDGSQARAPDIAEIAGGDPAILERLRRAERLFSRGVPILLQGETGTGKTLLARALHDAAGRGEFVHINCAAIPAELIESELFGYRAGAFTGAARQGSRGRLMQADGGTLFLDEIGDMPLPLQSRLLQVLSEKEFVPVGAPQPVKVDFRVIAASLRDVEQLVREQRFREDLYFRIQGARIDLLALAERADQDRLVERAFERAARQANVAMPALTDAARQVLRRYRWPGNLRELQHVARYAIAVCEGDAIDPSCLPEHLHRAPATQPDERPGVLSDARQIVEALQRARWNARVAAGDLGLSRATLYRRMREYGIERPRR